ncbi:MAG: Abi family protein [Bacteroidales bacterium]|nr:Abi family protein [Bacteroidales bacterium]MCF8343820.1 Abi family protein [Bacteroidales bacterium]MCF8350082.1 Abi family protein [Bacteroidales bacterium]MCF8374974.1 Abi family protein [Bacteroidales bacterium]MCF8402128.1 Abi family protein [Bacteroidales bacterium]
MPDYSKIKKYISAARLHKYELVCNNDERKILKLYQVNLNLSQSFYPLLSLFEVIIRNAINEELIDHFTDPNWLRNQRSGFMSDSALTYRENGRIKINDYLKSSVNKALRKLERNSSQDKIIADLTLGFWVSLFEKTHYRLLQGRPIQVFYRLPEGTNRSGIHKDLISIRNLRNRVYHNEPIIFEEANPGNYIFSLSKPKDNYRMIKNFFSYLNLDFDRWTRKINNIPLEINRAQNMIDHYPTYQYYQKRLHIGLMHYSQKYFRN